MIYGYFEGQQISEIRKIEFTTDLIFDSLNHSAHAHDSRHITGTDVKFNQSHCSKPCITCYSVYGLVRSPKSVEIRISGPKLTRKTIVDRAIRELKKQTDFTSQFSQNIEVQTIEKGNKNFHYIVRFSGYH